MYDHPHPDYNFPTHTPKIPETSDMTALTDIQLDNIRTSAIEHQPTPTIRISLYNTNRKLQHSNPQDQSTDRQNIQTNSDIDITDPLTPADDPLLIMIQSTAEPNTAHRLTTVNN